MTRPSDRAAQLKQMVPHVRLPTPDAELVEVALSIQGFAQRDVTIVSFDVGMKIRCEAAGLHVIRLDD